MLLLVAKIFFHAVLMSRLSKTARDNSHLIENFRVFSAASSCFHDKKSLNKMQRNSTI